MFSFDFLSLELYVVFNNFKVCELGVINEEFGYVVNMLIDGVYVVDYFEGGDCIDFVIFGKDGYLG